MQEMVRSQYEGLERQDAALDRVEAAATRVQRQAEGIRGEVTTHATIIDNLGHGVGSVGGRVQGVSAHVETVLQRMPRRLYYFTCFAVPFLAALALSLLLKQL